jgi:hypothetical protein
MTIVRAFAVMTIAPPAVHDVRTGKARLGK